MVIFSIIVFIFVLGLVILIHELGHFILAKRAGILCHEFSLGMGPILWSKRKNETLYTIRAIPIGGFVMMAGEEVEDEVVKVGSQIRIITNDFDIITKIIIDHTIEEYASYPLITVEKVDLKGKDDDPLYINDYTVKRDAFLVYKNREIQIAPHERSFESKTKMERFLSIFAGPFMNFVLAFFIFILLNLIIGFPVLNDTIIGNVEGSDPAGGVLQEGDEILSIDGTVVSNWDDISLELDRNPSDRIVEFVVLRDGVEETFYITPNIYYYSIGFHSAEGDIDTLVIGGVPEDTLADKAGFLEGDQIISIDGVDMLSWYDISLAITQNSMGEKMTFVVLRDGANRTLEVTPYNTELVESQGLRVVDSYVGIGPVYRFNFFRSIGNSFTDVKQSAGIIFTTLRLLFDNDQVGVDDLAGPVGIYQITSRALSAGFLSFLSWTALLSVNLGVINLLPIPALDGGRLVFLGYEAITNKKPNKKVENTLHYVMYIMLMGFFVYVTFNDILRLFNIK